MNNEVATCKEETCCSPQTGQTTTDSWVRPHYELDHNDEAFRLRIYIPGSAKSDVEISVDSGLLTLKAKRSDCPRENWKPLSRELSRNPYQIEVKLPDKVDVSKIGAQVDIGILLLTLPIREANKPRSIEVS